MSQDGTVQVFFCGVCELNGTLTRYHQLAVCQGRQDLLEFLEQQFTYVLGHLVAQLSQSRGQTPLPVSTATWYSALHLPDHLPAVPFRFPLVESDGRIDAPSMSSEVGVEHSM